MIKEDSNWVDRTNTGKIPRRDAWMSFFAQLLPGIYWGLTAVVLTPKALPKYYQDLYYDPTPPWDEQEHRQIVKDPIRKISGAWSPIL